MKKAALIANIIFVPILAVVFWVMPAEAYSLSDFQPGRIADDNTFFDPYGLSKDQIQNFLNTKIPVCDTWHSQTNSNYPPPYTCLKDYNQSTWSIPGDTYCNGFSGGNKSAAQIIYEVGVSCGVSQKVILVTLQKEQSFVTDTWPWPTQYNKAMGYGCPDSDLPYAVDKNNNNCYDEYEGFFKQVYYGTRQFKRYALDSNAFPSYRPYRTKYIQYNPNTNCGGSNVYIQNQATAGLYTYTPYQPNTGALSHKLSGGRYYDTSHPDCGAYGNINFWLLFSNWFGSPLDGVMITSPLKMTSEVQEGVFTQRKLTFTFDIQNYTPWSYGIGEMMIAARDSQGKNYDFGKKSVLLGPKGTYKYSASIILSTEETYTFWITNYRSSSGWADDFPTGSTDSLSRRVNNTFVRALPTIVEGPLALNDFRTGRTNALSFKIKNNSALPLNLGKVGLVFRDPHGANKDPGYDTVNSLAPGATYTYSKPFTPGIVGKHYATVGLTLDDGRTWNSSSFPGLESGVDKTVMLYALDNPTVTTGVTITDSTNLHVGKSSTLSFEVTNHGSTPVTLDKIGLTVRDPQGLNRDPRWDTVTIQPGTTYTYSVNVNFDKLGNWKVTIGNFKSGIGWNSVYPVNESAVIGRAATVSVKPNPTITTGVTITDSTNVRAGKKSTLSFQVTNHGSSPVSLDKIGLTVRDPQGLNRDPRWDTVTIQPGDTYTYNVNFAFDKPGIWKISIGNFKTGLGWNSVYPVSESGDIKRELTVAVKPNPTLVVGLGMSGLAVLNQTRTISFQVKNHGNTPVTLDKIGLTVRDPQGLNRDPRWDTVTIQPGTTYTYSVSLVLNKTGKWNIAIMSYSASLGWNGTYPASETAGVTRTLEPFVN